MNVVKEGDVVRFEYRHGGNYIRRVVPITALTEFLIGGQQAESNLGAGQEPMTFERFAQERYLTMNAKHRLKDSSCKREIWTVKSLCRFFGPKNLHEIMREDWENFKHARLSGKLGVKQTGCSEGTVLKEFKCLRVVLQYAADLGLIRRNVLADIKKLGLADGNRAEVWLTKEEIEKLLICLPEHLRFLFEFRILTGARPGEANQFGKENIDWEKGEVWLLNSKRKKTSRKNERRYLKIKSLGPRFGELLKSLTPHPVSGLFFCNPKTGNPYAGVYLARVFRKALLKSGVNKPAVSYDLRGTFATHRAMVVKHFRQLQTELGHSSPDSIQHYLDRAQRFDEKESIFYGIEELQ
jgi:integrase